MSDPLVLIVRGVRLTAAGETVVEDGAALTRYPSVSAVVVSTAQTTERRVAIPYYPGLLPYQIPFSASSSYRAARAGTGAPWQGPAYIGYQSAVPWLLQGNLVAAANMLNLVSDAQTFYAGQSGGTRGPFAPVFAMNTWDAAQFGSGFTWEGPDPNTSWGGFQYRAYSNTADFWQRAVAAHLSDISVARAAAVCNSFLGWLDHWLSLNQTATGIPDTFDAGVAPRYTADEAHLIALALRGTLWAKQAGANAVTAQRVITRLRAMLHALKLTTTELRGYYASNQVYGVWCGEILAALADYIAYT